MRAGRRLTRADLDPLVRPVQAARGTDAPAVDQHLRRRGSRGRGSRCCDRAGPRRTSSRPCRPCGSRARRRAAGRGTSRAAAAGRGRWRRRRGCGRIAATTRRPRRGGARARSRAARSGRTAACRAAMCARGRGPAALPHLVEAAARRRGRSSTAAGSRPASARSAISGQRSTNDVFSWSRSYACAGDRQLAGCAAARGRRSSPRRGPTRATRRM